MRSIHAPKTRTERRYRRHLRVRKRLAGTAERPRLVVFRSLKHVYAQLVDDDAGRTVAAANDLMKDLARDKAGKVGAAHAVGKRLAIAAREHGVKKVVFDRAGYRYHGRVKAVADGAREGGLEF
ncbi:MAG: 50S ribosomal protein L18 [Gemmatimonadetes bacterium RBG_16_66_8]|nr:MAG: 50S ribosomal protein L18 [Gemmatimonadetes bacterium RBG_16_66_8]